jgi:GrpB-like predicted nucleotidyltransferase (UPF0157 family)
MDLRSRCRPGVGAAYFGSQSIGSSSTRASVLINHNPDVQMHAVSVGHPEVERCLIFHDRLRMHPEDRELYERTRRELATRQRTYVPD